MHPEHAVWKHLSKHHFCLQTPPHTHTHTKCLTDGVLVLVGVDASVHDTSKQVVHDAGQCFSVQHAMQRTNKHRLTRVQTLSGAAYIVTVRDHPRDHLHL